MIYWEYITNYLWTNHVRLFLLVISKEWNCLRFIIKCVCTVCFVNVFFCLHFLVGQYFSTIDWELLWTNCETTVQHYSHRLNGEWKYNKPLLRNSALIIDVSVQTTSILFIISIIRNYLCTFLRLEINWLEINICMELFQVELSVNYCWLTVQDLCRTVAKPTLIHFELCRFVLELIFWYNCLCSRKLKFVWFLGSKFVLRHSTCIL